MTIPMQISFIPTAQDRLNAQHAMARSHGQSLGIFLLGSAMYLILYVVTLLNKLDSATRLKGDLAIGAYVLCWAAACVWSFRQRRVLVTEPDAVDVERTITVAEDGVTVATPRMFYTCAWSCITSVEITRGLLLLRMPPQNAIYIPSRVFDNAQQVLDFADQAEAYHKAAILSPAIDKRAQP